MNPANFHSMKGPSPGLQGNQQQAGQQQNMKVQQHIFRMLQQQQPPQGWQTAVPLQQRTMVVWQIVSSLRLIKPDMDYHQSINVALTFEQKTFEDSPDHASYEQACHRKLQDITETRNKQANSIQQQFQTSQQPHMNTAPQQMQMQGMVQAQNQGQFQPGFQNAQLPQAMQPSGMQMQQQQLPQQLHPQMMNPQSSVQLAPGQQPPHSQITQQNAQTVLTAEDQQQINRMAQVLARNTSKEQLDLIQNRLRNIAPEIRQSLAMQNLDPLTYYFRSQAASRYVAHKPQHPRTQMQGAPGIGLLPQQPRTTPQNSAAQAAGAPPPQTFDSSQILVQQQNGLRSQEAGQVVVPASNSQAMAEQQRGNGRGTGQQPNGQVNGAQSMQKPTQPYYPSQPTVPASNVSMQPQAVNYGNTTHQGPQHNLQGQLNGLNSSGRTPQQNTNMPNLNRAFGSPNQQAQAGNMRAQQRAQPNQQKDQNQMNPQQIIQPIDQPNHSNASMQHPRPTMLNLPPAMQQELAKMNEEQQNQFIAQLHRQRQQMLHQHAMQARAQGVQDSTLVQDQTGKPGPHITGAQPVQMMNGQPALMHNGNGLQQPAMVQPPSTEQQSTVQQRQQQQQQQRQNLQNQQKVAQMAGVALTDEQTRQMDNLKFPAGILNMNGAFTTMPPEVKTWSELKIWVVQNQVNLPPGTLEKLKGLQGLHYQNVVGQQRARMRLGPNSTGQPQGQAPPAQMVAPPSNQMPPGGSNTARMATPNMAHSLPQPTVQEIQASRARLPDHLKGYTDEQIRVQILKQRQHDMLKIAQGRPGMNPQQQAQFNQLQRAQQQQAQPNQLQPPSNQNNQKTRPAQSQVMAQRKQPQQSPRAGAPPKEAKDPVAKQPQGTRVEPAVPKPGQPNQKGIKRNSNDDVIEVPNPNSATPVTRGQPSKLIQASQQLRAGVPQNTEVQGQQAQHNAQQTPQALGSGPGQPHTQGIKPSGQLDTGPQRTDTQIRKEAQLQRICMEVAQSTPRGNPVPMNPQTRARMLQLLNESSKILSRIPSALPIFYGLIPNEQIFRDLFRTHILVAHQYRDKKYEHPVDHFTISLEVLDTSTKKLSKLFNWLMGQIQARKGTQVVQAPGQPQNQARAQQPQQPQQQPPKEPMPALNAANLQQQQLALQHVRAASLYRNHSNASVAMQKNPSNNSSRTPAAPTSTQPPFSFGGQPPHGVPQAYGDRPNELTQDKLQIPSAKRRKGNQAPSASSTPTLAQGTPAVKSSPQVTKLESPGVQHPPPASVVLRCPDPDCAMSTEEFMTRANLDAHLKRIHPNFNDPLEFCLESIRMGLNLDENGKSKVRPVVEKVDAGNAAETAPIQKSASTQGQARIKQEASTPMTRVPTQTGPSPASNLLKTPQTSNVKTPASDVKVPLKDSKAAGPKASQAAPKTPTLATQDLWVGSDIPASVITSAFSGLSELQSLCPWSKIQNTLTPDSTLSSGGTEKNSPRPSDIGENDAVNISINVDDTSWMPSEWFMDGMGGMEALNMDQELEGMDWGFDDAPAVENGKVGRGKERRDELAPSPEWLKIWAPDKL